VTSRSEFLGFHRPDARIGVRNHLLVLSSGGLTAPTARRIGASIAGAITVSLPYGVGLIGRDLEVHRSALVGLATHPNVGAVLVVGDNPEAMREVEAALAAAGRPHAVFSMDDCGHDALTLTDKGLRAGAPRPGHFGPAPRARADLGPHDRARMRPLRPELGPRGQPAPRPRHGPAGGRGRVGRDRRDHGMARGRAPARPPGALPRGCGRDPRIRPAPRTAAVAAGVDLTGSNPSPTNVKAGLSSIEEKSLGNIAKSGSRPIEGLIAYGDAPPGPGLWAMDASAPAPKSVTGFVIAGAQIVLFTTGVGNSYVSALAPTIKVSANPKTCAALGQQLDFDGSAAFLGRESLDETADSLRRRLLDIASGQATWGEILKEGDEVLSRFGPAL